MSKKKDDGSNTQYPVGYKKPPRKTQFKKGKSGNPKGRPKKSHNMVTLINEELDQLITIQLCGKHKTLTQREAIAKRIVYNALNGDTRSTSTILNMDIEREEINPKDFIVTADDKAMFERFKSKIAAQKAELKKPRQLKKPQHTPEETPS